jgi:hypothetical protein
MTFRHNPEIKRQIAAIPHRARIARNFSLSGVVAFAKRNGSFVFAFGRTPETVEIVAPEVALPLFNDIAHGEVALETTANFGPIYALAKEHIFKDNTKAPIFGKRKQDALKNLKFLAERLPSSRDLCDDIVKVVQELDGLPYGLLKEIAAVSMKDLKIAAEKVKELVPPKYLESIFETASRAKDTGKLIVLSEELIHHDI